MDIDVVLYAICNNSSFLIGIKILPPKKMNEILPSTGMKIETLLIDVVEHTKI